MIVSLLKPIRALQLVEKVSQKLQPGAFVEIPAGVTLELCGIGFNDRTLNVRVSGRHYLIFVEDIEPRQSLDADLLPYFAA